MRKHVLFLMAICVSGSSIFLNSCKKDVSQNSSSNNEAIKKVNSWLDEQKTGKPSNSVSSIELLKNSLDFASLRFEKSEEREKLLIVPIDKSLKSIADQTANSIPNLVLIIDKAGNIRKGYIVLYTGENGVANKIPDNTFYHIFNTAEPECNGKFSFHNIMGRLLYQLEYKDKWLHSVGLVKPKKSPAQNVGSRTQQGYYVDWYLVTTLYYVDGTSEVISEEYLYTTYVSDPDNPDQWPVDGGNAVDYEYEAMKDLAWHVYNTLGGDPLPTGVGNGVNATERIRGKRNSSYPYGGYFTSIVHLGSACNSGCDYGQYTYGEDSWDGTVYDNTTSSHVKGHFPDPNNGGVRVNVENTKNWLFSTVFP